MPVRQLPTCRRFLGVRFCLVTFLVSANDVLLHVLAELRVADAELLGVLRVNGGEIVPGRKGLPDGGGKSDDRSTTAEPFSPISWCPHLCRTRISRLYNI